MNFERILGYSAALEAHNERPWFHENHKWYEGAKDDFAELVELLKYRIAERVTPELAEGLIFAPAKNMIYRIPRDMRVYKHRPPYNPSFRAYFSPDKRAILPVSYYMAIQPGERSFFGTGAWTGGDRELLWQLREFISEQYERLEDALERSGCALMDGPEQKLKNVPRGFDPADPAAEYLPPLPGRGADGF